MLYRAVTDFFLTNLNIYYKMLTHMCYLNSQKRNFYLYIHTESMKRLVTYKLRPWGQAEQPPTRPKWLERGKQTDLRLLLWLGGGPRRGFP